MKCFWSVFGALLILATPLISQEIPLAMKKENISFATNDWYVSEEHCYNYDQQNRLVLDTGKAYTSDGEFRYDIRVDKNYDDFEDLISSLWRNTDQEGNVDTAELYRAVYNENNKLLFEEQWYGVGSRTQTEYDLDGNACYVGINAMQYLEQTDGSLQFVTTFTAAYERSTDCRALSRLRTFTTFESLTTFEYDSKDVLLNTSESRRDIGSQNWELYEERAYTYDSEGRQKVVALTEYRVDPVLNSRRTYEYDGPSWTSSFEETFDPENQTWRPSSIETFEYTPEGERVFAGYNYWIYDWLGNGDDYYDVNDREYEYDSNDNLIKYTRTKQLYINDELEESRIWEHIYTNRCDGSVLKEEVANTEYITNATVASTQNPWRKIYTYGAPADCESSMIETFSVLAYPNPANRVVHVQSELLYFPETTLYLFGSNGALVYEQSTLISKDYRVWLPLLPSGTYSLVLENKELEQEVVTQLVIIN